MKKVMFYLIDKPLINENGLQAHEYLACIMTLKHWQQAKKTVIYCESKTQAESIDEFLWRLDSERFIPHNLVGEGMSYGSPVEIAWQDKRSSNNGQLLINLASDFAHFSAFYQDVIDFVPLDDSLKDAARARYKSYKEINFNLKTIKLSDLNLEIK